MKNVIGKNYASEYHENLVVLLSYTVVQPLAMMIKAFGASIALATVFRFLIQYL